MDLKEKLARAARANLNQLLDAIKEFDSEEDGPQEGFEHIGGGPGKTNYEQPKSASEKTLRDYYANLEVEYGADMETVKASYRRLMRKYHPDKFAANDEMQSLSTELTQELTVAYQAIENYWKSGKY
jgi:DnaJ-domain-containing protein 1